MTNEEMLQDHLDEAALLRESLDSGVEITKTRLQLSLWAVGIAAPGMFVLAANVGRLKACSALSADALTKSYRLSQALFILSIVAALVLYRHFNNQLIALEQTKILSIHTGVALRGILIRNSGDGERGRKWLQDIRDCNLRVDAVIKRHSEGELSFRRHLPAAHLILVVAAYLILGVILISVDLGKAC